MHICIQKKDFMGNLTTRVTINRLVLSCTLGTFIFGTLNPLHASPMTKEVNVNLNDISFGLRIEKLVDKAKKYFADKNSNKLMEIAFDIKHEVEAYTGQKIDIDYYLDKIESEAKSKGQPVDKVHMKEMRKRFKKQEKRANHKAMYMATCMEHDLSYNAEEESLLFDNNLTTNFLMAKSTHGKHKDKDKDEEVVLPLRVTLGVTMSLAGFFLWMVPIPICKAAGQVVMDIGIAFLIDAGVTEWEEKENKK